MGRIPKAGGVARAALIVAPAAIRFKDDDPAAPVTFAAFLPMRRVSSCPNMQLETQRVDHAEDRVEVRTARAGERLVEALARQAGVARHLGHASGAGDVAQGLGDEGGVTLTS